MAIAEQLNEIGVDQQVLIKELADWIKIATAAMSAAGGTSSFFVFLLDAMIKGGGILATVGHTVFTVRDHASTVAIQLCIICSREMITRYSQTMFNYVIYETL